MVTVKCTKCGKQDKFETEAEAWVAGWDRLIIGGKPQSYCDKCPCAEDMLKFYANLNSSGHAQSC